MAVKNNIALPTNTLLDKKYRIIEILGQGGFGITYLADDRVLNRKVAIKEYLPTSLATRDMDTKAIQIHGAESSEAFQWGLDRFLKEARILAQLSHPNIVRVLNFMAENNTGYMVMEYEQGQVLKEWVKQFPGHRPPQNEIFKFLGPLLEALREVHSAGLAHRDIKPDNIYMRKDGSPVLLDFGAARNVDSGLSHTLAAIVTSGYSPHEQYGNVSDQGPWTDIYALGAVLYRLITGKTPPDSPSRTNASISDIPDPCAKLSDLTIDGFDEEFLNAIDWALQIRIKDRPQNIDQWIASFGANAQEKTQVITKPIPYNPSLGGSQNEEMPTQKLGIQNQDHEETLKINPVNTTETTETIAINPALSPADLKKKKSRNMAITAALCVMLMIGAAGAGYWWLSQSPEDLVGDTFENAKILGTLSETEKEFTDFLGNEDKSDMINFTVSQDSELSLKLVGGPSDIRLKIYDERRKRKNIYPLAESYLAELPRGSYTLQLLSSAKFASRYKLNLKTTPADLAFRPQNTLKGALNLSDLQKPNQSTIRYNGKLFPKQREHFFRLKLYEAAQVTITGNIQKGSGRIIFADEFGLAIEKERLNPEQAQIIKKTISAGTYHVIISSNEKEIFKYGLNVRLDEAQGPVASIDPQKEQIFIPIDGKERGPYLNAKATASLDTGMSKEEAILAAKTLARLRLVEKAATKKNTLPKTVARLANVVKLMTHLNAGITYDEEWKINTQENRVIASLKARFEKAENSKYMSSSLSLSNFKALTNIKFNIEAQKDMFLGVYGWQADGNVMRIYPYKNGINFIIKQGEKISLPPQGTATFSSTPVANRPSSDEAIFVVGCYFQANHTTIAQSMWKKQSKPVNSEEFFQRVATSCKQGLSINALPYTVYKEN